MPTSQVSARTIVHFVRHGQSMWNVEHRLTGWSDIDLTELGEEQARSLRGRLDPAHYDGVWSSDLVRARRTGELAGFAPSTDRRLRELHFGDYEGHVWKELDMNVVKAIRLPDFRAPGGESMDEMRTRIFSFLDELDHGQHIIFAHGGVVRVCLQHVGADLPFVKNCSVTEIDWTAGELIRQSE